MTKGAGGKERGKGRRLADAERAHLPRPPPGRRVERAGGKRQRGGRNVQRRLGGGCAYVCLWWPCGGHICAALKKNCTGGETGGCHWAAASERTRQKPHLTTRQPQNGMKREARCRSGRGGGKRPSRGRGAVCVWGGGHDTTRERGRGGGGPKGVVGGEGGRGKRRPRAYVGCRGRRIWRCVRRCGGGRALLFSGCFNTAGLDAARAVERERCASRVPNNSAG